MWNCLEIAPSDRSSAKRSDYDAERVRSSRKLMKHDVGVHRLFSSFSGIKGRKRRARAVRMTDTFVSGRSFLFSPFPFPQTGARWARARAALPLRNSHRHDAHLSLLAPSRRDLLAFDRNIDVYRRTSERLKRIREFSSEAKKLYGKALPN